MGTVLGGQTRALELALERAPLGTVLDVLVQTIETQSTRGALGSILLLDQDGVHLRHAASPSLPPTYTAGFDEIEIGPAFARETVSVDDIEHDPRWADHSALALAHGLRACWSTPIWSRHGHVLGTFALYQREVGDPTPNEQELVQLVARTAALVIEREWEARERQAAELELSRQVAALTRLHALASRLAQIDELAPKLREILAAAAEVHNTTCGLLSVHNAATGGLEVATSLNFSSHALESVRDITGGHAPAREAFVSSRRTIVEDTETDPRFMGYRLIARTVGFRAVHSTPILTRSGALLGVLSLHCKHPGPPSPLQIQLADVCALHAADAIEATRDRERLHDLVEHMSQLAWTVEEHGATWFNQRWCEYTGTTIETMRIGGAALVHHPDHIARVVAGWSAALHSGHAWEDTFPLRGRDGTYRWFLSRALPIRDATGKVVRWFGTNTDITESRETGLALAAASQAKDRFLAALSHELRTPLSPILMCASALAAAPELPDVLRGKVAMILRNVELETKLIDDLLDLSRITSGKLPLALEPVAIEVVTREVLEICQDQIAAKSLVVTVTHEGDGIVDADPARFRQILWNVLKNAAKFTPAGGTIAIRSSVLSSRRGRQRERGSERHGVRRRETVSGHYSQAPVAQSHIAG
ncbi:MAG: GAF domain-containing protein [Deltaproteobacteria bacterium]|nr:GAF domain-containing protein [Deltaproteobacteria bacterium]